jgi:hypothetical protein
MNSETSTEQFYFLLAMIAATAAVIVSKNTHPVALVLLSAAILGTGLVAIAVHRALAGFFGAKDVAEPALGVRAREDLLREKALVLRSIKELEFDRSMGKVSEADFAQLSAPLRARALSLMQAIEREPVPSHAAPAPSERPSAAREALGCPSCGRKNDADAKFCKSCGARLERAR